MKNAAIKTAICRKTLRSAGMSTDGACNDLPATDNGHGLTAEELRERIGATIVDCVNCKRRAVSAGHHDAVAAISRAQGTLKGHAERLERETSTNLP